MICLSTDCTTVIRKFRFPRVWEAGRGSFTKKCLPISSKFHIYCSLSLLSSISVLCTKEQHKSRLTVCQAMQHVSLACNVSFKISSFTSFVRFSSTANQSEIAAVHLRALFSFNLSSGQWRNGGFETRRVTTTSLWSVPQKFALFQFACTVFVIVKTTKNDHIIMKTDHFSLTYIYI